MTWRAPLEWVEGLLRAGLWRLESRLALVTIAALALLITVAAIWWDSSDEVRNFGLIAAAVIALPLAIWRSRVSERQAETARRALLDERFSRAVSWLTSEDARVRTMAVEVLRQLANDYPEHYRDQVLVLLTQAESVPNLRDVEDDDDTPT